MQADLGGAGIEQMGADGTLDQATPEASVGPRLRERVPGEERGSLGIAKVLSLPPGKDGSPGDSGSSTGR